MKSSGPFWKALNGFLVLGMALSPVGIRSHTLDSSSPSTLSAPAAWNSSVSSLPASSPSDCRTQPVRITLASEQIIFCSPTALPISVVEDSRTNPHVSYASLDQLEGYATINVRAASPGVAPGPNQPVYNSGGQQAYRQAQWGTALSRPNNLVSSAPLALLWGQKVPGLQVDFSLPTSLGDLNLRTIEWDLEHNGRLWTFILTWDKDIKNADAWEAASEDFSVQNPSGEKLADTALDLGAASLESQSGLDEISAAGGPADVELPSWWQNEICDYSDYYEGTGVIPVALGSPWHGVYPCGTTPRSAMVDFGVYFFPGAWGQFEWECVELVMRFLYLEWGIAPFKGNASQIKDNRPTATVDFYQNDGTHPIIPGDIITEDASVYNSAGHTMVVNGTHLDTGGELWVDIMEQNTGAPGAVRSLHVNKTTGIIDPDPWCYGQIVQGWLHVKANQPSGDSDPTFVPTGLGLNGPVTTIGLQSDNKIILGGDFTGYDITPRNHVARLNIDATLDAAFDPAEGVSATGTPQVFAMKVQADNAILLGGEFDHYGVTERANLVRLTGNGLIDAAFIPPATMAATTGTPSINAIAIQPGDSKVLIGGNFNALGGGANDFIARLGADGALDPLFTGYTDGIVYAIAIQTDDKILIAGAFTQVNGVARAGVARLTATGELDPTFDPMGVGTVGAVTALALQEDKILIAGNFSAYNGTALNMIARLNGDGLLESTATFNPGTGVGGTSPYLTSVVTQPDGRILIGGSFSSYNGANVNNFVRLNNNGTLDTTFLSRMDSAAIVKTILLQPDYKILIGGSFTGNVARLLNAIEPCYTLTTLVNPSAPIAGGTVTVNLPPNCPGGKYISGTVVQLSAARNEAADYWFTNWSGDASGTSNQLNVTMNHDKSITANFITSPGSFGKTNPDDNHSTPHPATVTLSWETSAGATSYEYCLNPVGASTCPSDIWTSTGSSTSVMVTNLLPSVTYAWQVRARNQVDTTDSTDGWWHFNRDGVPAIPVPISPTGMIVDPQPAYVWNESPGATSYHLVAELADASVTLVDQDVSSSACAAGVCNLRPVVTLALGNYHFRVSARATSNASDYSPWQTFTEAIGIFIPLIMR